MKEADRSNYGRKKKGLASTLPSKPKQCRAGKRKRNDAVHSSDKPTGAKKTCLLHDPGHSSEECKFLKYYTKKRSAYPTYKDKLACSGGKKRAKTVKFEDATQEVNIMKSHDEPTPKKRKKKKTE